MAQSENVRTHKEWNVQGSLDIESGGDLTVKSGGSLVVDSGADVALAGDIAIESGSTLDVESGGAITVASGGSATVESGAALDVAGTLGINSGGVQNVESGGVLNVVSGGVAAVAVGGALNVAGQETVSGDLDLTGTLSKDGVDVTENLSFTFCQRLTVAEINAGFAALPAVAGKAYRVTGVKMRAIGGAVGSVTSINIQDGDGTPVIVASFAQANLTQNTILNDTDTGVTPGAGYLGTTTVNTVLNVIKIDTDIDTATHVDVVIEYQVIAAS